MFEMLATAKCPAETPRPPSSNHKCCIIRVSNTYSQRDHRLVVEITHVKLKKGEARLSL